MIAVRLAGIRYESAEVRCFELAEPTGRALPAVPAGSHLVLRLPNGAERPYFIAERTHRGTYVIGVRRDPDGTAAKYLHDKVRAGALLEIDVVPAEPLPAGDDPVALFAEDVGIFYAWSLARELDARGRAWTLWYDAWSREDAPLASGLRAFGECVRVTLRSERGGLAPDWQTAARELRSDVRILGAGTSDGAASLAEALVRDGRGLAERVRWTRTVGERPHGPFAFEVVLARSGRTVAVHEDESILEALEAAGIASPHFCRGGICGRCRTHVLEGTPVHRDAVLTERERSANDVMMICRSRTRDARLVLDR